jgi:putative intracellular protease/amidase
MRQTYPIIVGMILFPNLTQLDLTGPYEVFARMPNSEHLVATSPLLAPGRHLDVHPVFEVFVTSDPGTTATCTATATPAQAAQRSYSPP